METREGIVADSAVTSTGDQPTQDNTTGRRPLLVFYGRTGQTKKFVNRVGAVIDVDTLEITAKNATTAQPPGPYVLVTPSYGAGKRDRAVPAPVYKFLSNRRSRDLCIGTVGGGNTNYGIAYGYAADILAAKLTQDQQRRDPGRETRTLFKFEGFGLPGEPEVCAHILQELWDEKFPPEAA